MNCKNILFDQCAPGTVAVLWNFINWDTVKHNVKSLQRRIAKAISDKKLSGNSTDTVALKSA